MVQALTLLIAAFVAWIGYLQWRTAQQKAVLDLFDKRFKIYEVVKHCVDQVVCNPGYFGGEVEKEFLKAVSEAYFLFGDNLHSYLETLRKDIVKVRDVSKLQADGAKGVEWPTEAMNRINNFHEDGQPLFAKYMRFSQTVPLQMASSRWQRLFSYWR